MLRRILFLILVLLPLASLAQEVSLSQQPSLPHLIRFSGLLAGHGIRTVGLTFALYKDQSGGAPLWQEVQNVALNAGGHYSVLLGANSKDGIPAELFTSNEARWLGVQVEQEPEQPRVLLVSVPYALKAGDAETIGGHPVSDFLLSTSSNATSSNAGSGATNSFKLNVTSLASATVFPAVAATPPVVNYLAKFLDTGGSVGNSQIFDNGTNVGINNGSPAYTLDVGGVVNAPNVFVQGTSPRLRLLDTTLPNSFWELQQSAYFPDNFGILRYENNTAVPSKSLLVAANGNVGIGTINPGFKLDVAGAVNTSTLLVNSASPRVRLIDNTLPNSFWELQQSAFFPDNFGFLRYENNAAVPSKSFLVAANGNVGIGTINPANKLSVAGVVESTSGGFKFPDGKVQASVALSSVSTTGSSLSGNGTASSPLAVNTSVIQQRVSQSCATGQAVQAVAPDGTVTCVSAGGGSAGVTSFNGRTGPVTPQGGDYSYSQLSGNVPSAALSGTYGNAVTFSSSGNAFTGSGAGLTNVNAATVGGQPITAFGNITALRTRSITYIGGCDSCGALTDSDDDRAFYYNVVGTMTIQSVTCFSDAGTPIINLQRDDGTPANILTSDLTCSTTGAPGTINGSESVLNLNDRLNFVMVTAGGTAKRVTVVIKALIN